MIFCIRIVFLHIIYRVHKKMLFVTRILNSKELILLVLSYNFLVDTSDWKFLVSLFCILNVKQFILKAFGYCYWTYIRLHKRYLQFISYLFQINSKFQFILKYILLQLNNNIFDSYCQYFILDLIPFFFHVHLWTWNCSIRIFS